MAGSGTVQEKEKARLAAIIEKVNDLFEGELTDQDKLVYVNSVIKGKLLESETLRQQAANNTKEQFTNASDLKERTPECHHGRAGRSHADEHAGAEFGNRTGRHQRHSAQPRRAIRDPAHRSGCVSGQSEWLPRRASDYLGSAKAR